MKTLIRSSGFIDISLYEILFAKKFRLKSAPTHRVMAELLVVNIKIENLT